MNGGHAINLPASRADLTLPVCLVGLMTLSPSLTHTPVSSNQIPIEEGGEKKDHILHCQIISIQKASAAAE